MNQKSAKTAATGGRSSVRPQAGEVTGSAAKGFSESGATLETPGKEGGAPKVQNSEARDGGHDFHHPSAGLVNRAWSTKEGEGKK